MAVLHLFSYIDAWKFMLYFEKQLVLCNSLHWFDQVRGDGVSKAMSLLDFLQVKTRRRNTS